MLQVLPSHPTSMLSYPISKITFLVKSSKSGSALLVISPAKTTKLSLTKVSHATLDSGSSLSIASSTASDI